MPETDWYEIVDRSDSKPNDIRQGDILLDCPVYSIDEVPPTPPDGFAPLVNILRLDLVVVTQSCDLKQDKVDQVLLAQVSAWKKLVDESDPANSFIRSSEFRKKLVDGVVPGYSLLSKCDAPVEFPWSVVNFHKLYVLPKSYLRSLASVRSPRLRLQPPYLEHMSQAFARYFMRVGLPHQLEAFIKEGK